MNTGVHVSLTILVSSVCMPSSGIAGSFGSSSMAGFPGGSDSKELARNAGDPGFIPGSGRSPGEGNGNSLQHSCLENPMDERA